MTGRIRCGRCRRVLRDDRAERRLRPHEQAELAELVDDFDGKWWEVTGLLLGREKHLMATGAYSVRSGRTVWTITCKCGRPYREDAQELRRKAIKAGGDSEDLYLT